MGHRFSAVHGVKSENYYKPGNAINEIWFGNVELISRLPFGDSDMGQAAWPIGSWPKIPWHNFIIPLKRRSFTVTTLDSRSVDEQNSMRKRAWLMAAPFSHVSRGASVAVLITLSFLLGIAFYLPVALRQRTVPYSRDTDIDRDTYINRHKQKERRYAILASIATTSLVVGIVIGVLQFRVWATVRDVYNLRGAGFLVLGILGTLAGLVSFFYSVKAVSLLWIYWWKTCQEIKEESNSVSDGSVDKRLPGILVSWLERQRRP